MGVLILPYNYIIMNIKGYITKRCIHCAYNFDGFCESRYSDKFFVKNNDKCIYFKINDKWKKK